MSNYQVKTVSDSVQDVDDKSRRVKVAVSEMGTLDLDNDVMDPTAYNRTIKQRGPKGTNLIWHLTDHRASLKDAVGKPSEIYVEGNKLVFVTDVPNTAWGNDVMEFYKSGMINQHSVGFRTIQSEPQKAGTPQEHNLIKEALLYEGSAVLWAAHPSTPTLSVGKSLTKEEREKEYFATLKEVNNLAKLFKSGHLTDETFELLEMRLAMQTEKLKQLFETTTQPAEKALDPVDESLLNVLKTFNNTLITESWTQHNCKRS